MRVNVRFFGLLSERYGNSQVLQVPDGSIVADLLGLFGVEERDVSLCIVNGPVVAGG